MPPAAAITSAGATVVGYTVEDQDHTQNAAAYAAMLDPGSLAGAIPPLQGANQLLAVGSLGRSCLLLEGLATAGRRCCSSVRAAALGMPGAPRTLLTGIREPATGTLVPMSDGGALALVATASGIWGARANSSGTFSGAQRLTPATATPAAFAATALPNGGSAVGWSLAPRADLAGAVGSITIKQGTAAGLPSASSYLGALPGDSIDQLSLAAGVRGASAVWVESYTDTLGAFHSVVETADAGALPAATQLSASAEIASAVAVRSDLKGDEVAVFKQCDPAGNTCSGWLATRRGARPFSALSRLGSIDPTASPAVAVGADGSAAAGWIDGGAVKLRVRPAATAAFGSPSTLGAAAMDLTLAAGPAGRVIAVWSQGAVTQRVFGSLYS